MDPAILVLWALTTGHPDAAFLKAQADSVGVPPLVAWAVAYQETRYNLDSTVQGGACRGKPNCELGRMQIKPSTARVVCPTLDIRRYRDNVRCGMLYLRRHYDATGSWEQAIRWYQCPTCRAETHYQREVLATIGRYVVRANGGIP